MALEFNTEKYLIALDTIKRNPHGSQALKEEIEIVQKYLRKVA